MDFEGEAQLFCPAEVPLRLSCGKGALFHKDVRKFADARLRRRGKTFADTFVYVLIGVRPARQRVRAHKGADDLHFFALLQLSDD